MQRQTNNRISVWDGLFYNDIPSAQYETFHVADCYQAVAFVENNK